MAETSTCQIGSVTIGPAGPLAVIAGPCVLESREINRQIADVLCRSCAKLGLPYVFKASFDKANRSSIRSERGPGIDEGLRELESIGLEFDVPVTTDVHLPDQAEAAAQVVHLLQVPAFLCRQTDLLVACAKTKRPVNVKKGQFMAPVEMNNVLSKLAQAGCTNRMLTERGTFFGYHRLVNDFVGLGDMMELGAPVCFDVTHSTQLPGGGGTLSAGRPERAPLLARAAVAAGVHAIFLECHPQPQSAHSDAATVLSLETATAIIRDAATIRAALSRQPEFH